MKAFKHRPSLCRIAGLTSARQIFGVLINLFTVLVLVNRVHATQYGLYALFLTYSQMSIAIFGAGLFPANYLYIQRNNRCFRFLFLNAVVTLLLATVFIALISFFISGLYKAALSPLALLLMATSSLWGTILSSFSLGMDDFHIFNIGELIVPVAFAIIVLLLPFRNADQIAVAFASANALKTAFHGFYCIRVAHSQPQGLRIRLSQYWKYAVLSQSGSTLATIWVRLLFITLQQSLSPSKFGTLSVAWTILDRTLILPQSFNLVSFGFQQRPHYKLRKHNIAMLLVLGLLFLCIFTLTALTYFFESFYLNNKSYEGLFLSFVILGPFFLILGGRLMLQNTLVANDKLRPIIFNNLFLLMIIIFGYCNPFHLGRPGEIGVYAIMILATTIHLLMQVRYSH